jgi:hypothetical protein
MHSRWRASLVALVAAGALFGMATTAKAASKSIWAMMIDQNLNTPDGVTYRTCSGNPVWAQASGFDSSNIIACGARAESNGAFIQIPCGTAPVTFQSTVRTFSNAIFCHGDNNPWYGTISACSTGPILFQTSQTSGCNSVNLAVWGRGYY